MRPKRGEISINWQTTKDNHKCSDEAGIVFMETPFETLEQHDDHAHSDETSHEKLMQPKQTQNSGPLLKTVLGEYMGELTLQTSVAHQHHSRHHSCQWYRPTEEEHEMASVTSAPVN